MKENYVLFGVFGWGLGDYLGWGWGVRGWWLYGNGGNGRGEFGVGGFWVFLLLSFLLMHLNTCDLVLKYRNPKQQYELKSKKTKNAH